MKHFTAILTFLAIPAVAHGLPPVGPAPLPAEAARPASTIETRNHHPFGIRETVRFPLSLPEGDGAPMAISQSVAGGAIEVHYIPVQVEERDGALFGWIDLQLRAGENREYRIERFAGGREPRKFEPPVDRFFESGLPAAVSLPDGQQTILFDLALIESGEDLDDFAADREGRIRSFLANAIPGSFDLEDEEAGSVFRRLRFAGELQGINRYEATVTYTIATSGLVDVTIDLDPLEIREERAYLALAKRVPGTNSLRAAVRWKGETREMAGGGMSPDRTDRIHYRSRDVNWLAVHGGEEEEAPPVALLARFTPNLTRVHNDRYHIVNDFLVNEIVAGDGDGWWMLAEIARENRLREHIPQQFVVPAEGERVRLEYRALPANKNSLEEIDQAFISFAGYQGLFENGDSLRLDFGVDGVSFGTSYFPHSTFGENFEHWRSGGLDGDRRWPRFGEGWRHFKDEIRRDLRIANALGLDWIRIHNFNSPDFRSAYLASDDGRWMLDYLEFLSEESRNAGLGLVLDISVSPEDARLVAERFGDAIGYYEIQNDVLMLGAFLDRLDYWRSVRDNIRDARPDAVVFVTGGPQFDALYNRIEELDFPSGAIAQHAYVEARQTPSWIKDIAVSAGGLASRRGLVSLVSQFNWRMITREPEEAQAQHFWEIGNDLLSQRGTQILLQFQFQETVAVPPRNRGALRHNELVRLDRTPKPQAWAFADLIRRYGRADSRARQVSIRLSPIQVQPGVETAYQGQVMNPTSRPVELTIAPELPDGITAENSEPITITLGPRQNHRWERVLHVSEDLTPGYHHFFERVDFGDFVQFGWAAAIHSSPPRLDLDAPLIPQVRYQGGIGILADANLHEIEWLVFGRDAPSLEVDWTLYLYNTLRAAAGTGARRMAHNEFDEQRTGANLLLVGTPGSNPAIQALGEKIPLGLDDLPPEHGAILLADNPNAEGKRVLIVTGSDSAGVERAASDLVYRYWRHAKEAATFRDGMPAAEIGAR